MVIYDVWQADDGYSSQGEEVGIDVSDWPSKQENRSLTLRLEEMTHHDISMRRAARKRNLDRLKSALTRDDITHLEAHYTCCVDKPQREALETLLQHDDRDWHSFTLQGNGMNDFFTKPHPLDDLFTLFMTLKKIKVLNLNSCALYRGHGLEEILKTIPFLLELKELRLQGWQMDRVSVEYLIESLRRQETKEISLLSLRSCYFLGTETFDHLVSGLFSLGQPLQTINLSYCNLQDSDISALVQSIKEFGSVECLHVGGNQCTSQSSVRAISELLRDESCRLRDLNLRALWIGWDDNGLLQRRVNLADLHEALKENQTVQSLTISENCLENDDIINLTQSLNSNKGLSHLDLGDNPFDDRGAKGLLHLVQNRNSLESIRFENHFLQYQCSDAIKAYARFNYFDRRLLKTPTQLVLPLWPRALARVQESASDQADFDDGSPDTMFRLLRSTTGDVGLPLYLRIAQSNNS